MTSATADRTLIVADVKAALEDGTVAELVRRLEAGDFDGLDRLLPRLHKLYESHPRDRKLGHLVGVVQQIVIREARRPGREKEIAADRKRRIAANAEYRDRVDLEDGPFWRLVEQRYPEGCPACGEKITGYARRLGQWKWRCGWQMCRHEESIVGYLQEQEAADAA